MKITAVQWNIGGGKIPAEGSDPTLLASYDTDGLSDIIAVLKKANADIITLQEVHRDDNVNQAEHIAHALGMKYSVSDFYADSHIEEGQKLGHAILSKYPIHDKEFHLFPNPNLEVEWEDGSIAHSHDKGITAVSIEVDGHNLEVATTHLTPFRRFGVDLSSEQGKSILSGVQNGITLSSEYALLQGDFNIDSSSLKQWLPALFKNDFQEVLQVDSTTPKDQRLDHVLYRGLTLISTESDPSVKTDHYPVISQFEL